MDPVIHFMRVYCIKVSLDTVNNAKTTNQIWEQNAATTDRCQSVQGGALGQQL